MGYGSRRDIHALARLGAITLDGVDILDAERRIAVTADLPARMSVDGRPLDPPPGLVLMLHKPLGVTCSHKEAGPLVYDLLPSRWRARDPAVSTVGRLDKETSGLLLMTDDGALLHRIISPKAKLEKSYVADLARPLDGTEGAAFATGTLMLEGEDKPLLPAVLEVLSPTRARLTITEGRYHQVRRMFAAVGNHVETLHRDRVGGLSLPGDLAAGRYRVLDETAVAGIFA
ncbi:MAG TPA: 16S rRNA pseudouridine(516) synthase [Caulobacteraceae bacterium]